MERRLTRGQTVGAAYAREQRVDAVMIGGSVARGYADRWSDLEIGIFWREIPAESLRSSLAATLGLQDWRAFEGTTSIGAVEEDADVDGIRIDLVHLDTMAVARVLHDVIDLGDASLDKQVLIAALRDGIPVHGGDPLQRWRARSNPYPKVLRDAMVGTNLVFGPHAWLEMLADRGICWRCMRCSAASSEQYWVSFWV